ncbi:hypothetical protein B7R54_02270 [Subtercola boreus]|uniref:Uncharacterized protein n=1 Tax=Subtercola boreus TaxID=120213 RepID=A0A3E0VF47_9MICO|nr:hypothetical protein [Subtercola boreus]RFA08173.1 hypothetical protein B7R54_02270 [Subtercola boreus]TQL54936.1 hypothetical protein FB464_2486 [Subtercola boreus]
MTTGVHSSHAPYRQALGGLGRSAGLVAGARGAVTALAGGAGWPGLLEAAARAGAASAVVDNPVAVPGPALAALLSLPFPVVLERRYLRPDLCDAAVRARAGVPPRAIVVECAGGEAETAGLLGDGIGWARVFAGGELVVRSVGRQAGGLVALLDGPGMLPVTVLSTRLQAPGAAGLLRVGLLGETRSDVTIDPVAGVADVDTATAAGTFRAAPRYESSTRLALRRALGAAVSGEPVADLREWMHDSALAAALLDAVSPPYRQAVSAVVI